MGLTIPSGSQHKLMTTSIHPCVGQQSAHDNKHTPMCGSAYDNMCGSAYAHDNKHTPVCGSDYAHDNKHTPMCGSAVSTWHGDSSDNMPVCQQATSFINTECRHELGMFRSCPQLYSGCFMLLSIIVINYTREQNIIRVDIKIVILNTLIKCLQLKATT